MKASAAIQILPKTDSNEELIRIVDEVISYIDSTSLHYFVGPFETAIECDDFDYMMEVIKNCHKIAIEKGSDSVSAYIKICYTPEKGVLTIDEKVSKYH